MPDPIDFTRVNIGFQTDRESLTDFTAGYPINNEGAIRLVAQVATGEDDILDGMIVTVASQPHPNSGVTVDAGGGNVTYTLDGGDSAVLTVVGSDITSDLAVGDTFTLPAKGSVAVTQTFTITAAALDGSDTDITFDDTELGAVAILDPGTGVAYANQTAADDFATDFDTEVITFYRPSNPVEASKATTTTSVQDLYLAADSAKTFNGQYDREGGKITLLSQNYEFKTPRITNVANLTFQPNDHPLYGVTTTVGFSTLAGVDHTIDGSETYTVASNTINLDADLSDVTEGDRIHIPATGDAAAQVYTVLSVTFNDPDTDLVIAPGDAGVTDILDPSGGAAYANQTAADDFATDYDTVTVTFSTPNVKVVIDEGTPADSTITLYALDYSDEIRTGDVLTLTTPALWSDDRDSTTDEVASTQASQEITVSSVTLTSGNTVMEFDNAVVALKDPGTTAYDDYGTTNANPDTYLPQDFGGASISYNRVAADFYPGLAVGVDAGEIALLGGATEQIVGHVTDTDPLLKTLTISPYHY